MKGDITGRFSIKTHDAWKWRQIESVIHETMSLFNFHEVRPSILSNYHLLARVINHFHHEDHAEMAVAGYLRLDKPDEDHCLRPEGTIAILNSNIAEKALHEIQKVYYLGPMFRKNGNQGIDEFNQLGIEILGSSTMISDDEAIRLSLQLCKKFGFGNSWVEIASHGCENCRPGFMKARNEFIREHRSDFCPECAQKMLDNPFYMPECDNAKCKETYKTIPKLVNFLCDDCVNQFHQLKKTLSNLTTNYKVNHDLARDYNYYRQTVFNVLIDTAKGPLRIGGGGRYDDLSHFVTGHTLPSVGFALELDQVFNMLEERGLFIQPDSQFKVYLCMQNPGLETIIMQISEELRNNGFSTVIGANCEDFQKECDLATHQNCTTMIVVNANDIREGKVLLKNFLKEHQEYLKLSDLIPQLSVIRKTF
ncbi:MAG TPA: ATP phosphoribosyltransferase regulatory subunit, partial [Candidatus Cloacimonadota bacterium]|nr:ATP phosphoribosyltransferase regulatory subunit [Candidatus Cloacimonadota bacterium]